MPWREPVGVDGHVVRALRVPVAVTWLIGSECAMRKAMMAAIHLAVHLPLEARLETGPVGGRLSRVVLHAEQMRRQAKAVPRVLG